MLYPKELKERVVWQQQQSCRRGKQLLTAQLLGVTTRSIRNWKTDVKLDKKVGRKKIKITLKEKIVIAKEWKRQGYPGTRPVIKSLSQLRIRAVREVIGQLKQRRQKRYYKVKTKVRTSIKVYHAGTVGSMDGTSIKRGNDFVVYRDRGSLKINAEKCESNLRSIDTIKVLDAVKAQRQLPFVLCTDNGSPFCAGNIEDYLSKNYIIQLKNLPHVPQHNGACERAVREFKEVFIENLDPEKTIKILNNNRLRPSLSWQTSNEFEKNNYRIFELADRIKFYENTKEKIYEATENIKSRKEKRKKEREAILKNMELYGLIKINRGNQSRCAKPETIT